MRYTKKKKRTGSAAVITAFCALFILLLALLLWLEFGAGKQESNNGADSLQQTESTTVLESTAPEHAGMIATPYLDLYYDPMFSDCLVVVHNEGTPYTLAFYASLDGKPDQKLFDIAFGNETDGNLGAIKINSEIIPVSMVIYIFEPDDSWTEDEISTVFAMQEMANDLIDQLMRYQTQDDFTGPVIAPVVPEANCTTIETPYCDLSYSSQWLSYLHVEKAEGEDYRVLFYGQINDEAPVLLFTIIFGGDAGNQVGVIIVDEGQIVTVNIEMEALDRLGWPENDMDILYEMQEAVNEMIERMPLE